MITVVSTHFDDAVFSCWTVLTGEAAVEVLTVFTAGPDDDRVTEWDADTGVTSAERMVQRAAENSAALALAGRRAVNLGLREGQYDGGHVDPSVLREPLSRADVVYVPAGSGSTHANREHAVVRDACLAVCPHALVYADNPYWYFRDDATLPPGLDLGLRRVVVELTPSQREQKADAIACYAGELMKLEGFFGPCTDPSRLQYEVFWESPGD